MQERSGTLSSYSAVKLKNMLSGRRKWIWSLAYLASGFIMANSSVFGGISPFGVAFCASVPGRWGLVSSLGAVLGYTLAGSQVTGMKYIAAIMLVCTAKWLFISKKTGLPPKGFLSEHSRAATVAAVFFSLLAPAFAVAFSGTFTIYDLVLQFSEMLFACGATYFFARSVELLNSRSPLSSKADMSCAVISVALAATGLAGFEIGGLCVGRIVSVTAVLFCARYGGEAAGSVAGIVAGIAMALSGGDVGYVAVAYSFGGLIAGIFGVFGRIGTAASFIVTNAVVALLLLEGQSVYTPIFEVFAATVVFVAIPQEWLAQARPVRTADGDNYVRSILRERLGDVSTALLEIGATTHKVSEGLTKMETTGTNEVAAKVVEQVCRRCGMKGKCWQSSRKEAVAAMDSAIRTVQQRGRMTRGRAHEYFANNCGRLDDLISELNVQFQGFSSRRASGRKIARARAVVTDQFEGLSLIMDEIAGEICSSRVIDEQKAKRVREYFEREGIAASRVQAYVNECDRLCVSFTIPNYQAARLHRTKAALDLSQFFECELDLPQITARKQHTAVMFNEKAAYTAELGAYQIAGGGNRLCGDTYEYLKNKSGKTHLILSDGMGSGGNAAVDSTMASGLMMQLLSVGVSHDAALKMVNAALMIKSGDESLSTVDVTTIDLFTGRADFFKAGAAPTFILKNGKAGYVDASSIPAGILRGVTFEHSVMSLRDGDIVVMMSDGVTASGSDWVKQSLEEAGDTDMQGLCERLATEAKTRRTDKHEDDITVMATAIRAVRTK